MHGQKSWQCRVDGIGCIHIFKLSKLAEAVGKSSTKVVSIQVPAQLVSRSARQRSDHDVGISYNELRLCSAPILGRVP